MMLSKSLGFMTCFQVLMEWSVGPQEGMQPSLISFIHVLTSSYLTLAAEDGKMPRAAVSDVGPQRIACASSASMLLFAARRRD